MSPTITSPRGSVPADPAGSGLRAGPAGPGAPAGTCPDDPGNRARTPWPRIGITATLLLLPLLITACGSCRADRAPSGQAQPAPSTATPLVVAVTVAPQRYFVERLARGRAAVQVLLPPGANHESYEPTLSFLTALAGARLWFQVGPARFPFEQAWSDKVLAAAPGMKPVDTSIGVALLGANPHIWLSPRRVVLQARTMARVLAEEDPAGRTHYQANLASFERELADLDLALDQQLAPVHGRTLVIFHPSWDYFAADYGFSFLAIEQEGHEPGAAGLEKLIVEARRRGARDVFVEPNIGSRLAGTIAGELGGSVVVIDPLPADWPDGLRRAARTIAGHAR
ncbi:MAG: cation ABC transporter substrate-binding protein [Deltaproteobacteria bacterium]|nr:cation ABC transporter substrate-binding protein [Deltaproteobacteria bacterium]